MLDFTLARFVAEVRKEDGQEYPGKTLYEILSSIEMYLPVQCKRNITLIDKKGCTFRNLNKLMNIILLNTIIVLHTISLRDCIYFQCLKVLVN